jgi:hypothetical protein
MGQAHQGGPGGMLNNAKRNNQTRTQQNWWAVVSFLKRTNNKKKTIRMQEAVLFLCSDFSIPRADSIILLDPRFILSSLPPFFRSLCSSLYSSLLLFSFRIWSWSPSGCSLNRLAFSGPGDDGGALTRARVECTCLRFILPLRVFAFF